MKIQTQTAILFTTITATIILLLSGFIYFFTSRFATTDFYKRLEIRAYIAARVMLEKDETSVDAYSEIRREHLEMLPGEKEYFIRLDTLSKRVLKAGETVLPASFIKNVVSRGKDYFSRNGLYYTGIFYKDNEGDFAVVISAGSDTLSKTIANLRYFLILGFLAGTLLIYATAIFFSRYTFKPVRTIIKKVKSINAENLSMRLPEKKGKDEIWELSYTFNEMLDRLQTSFETQNNFVSNASHEFRTPITAIIGEAELALSPARTQEELRQSIQSILSQAEKMQHISNSLLSLAQTGFDGKRQEWRPVRIDELIWEVKYNVEKIVNAPVVYPDLQYLPSSPDDLVVEGNEQLLKLAFSNIVLNACKYSDNRSVTVTLRIVEDYIHIITEDKGIGIPEDDLAHVFEPFFRASNSLKFQGYGIGLPLSLNIIRLHHGMIKVDSAEGKGTRVLVALPAGRK
ncbi:MAG TPA: HAMP domain-containing sensor histidine kinase [Chitinophagaceae bacterium]|nr:HAMP domain-containing sensor histidine kinase [Chitinophagaceae bacterium]